MICMEMIPPLNETIQTHFLTYLNILIQLTLIALLLPPSIRKDYFKPSYILAKEIHWFQGVFFTVKTDLNEDIL